MTDRGRWELVCIIRAAENHHGCADGWDQNATLSEIRRDMSIYDAAHPNENLEALVHIHSVEITEVKP
jgi:hypothetical protein